MAETSLRAHGHRHQARKLVHAAPWSIPTSEAAAKVKHSLVEVEHMFAVIPENPKVLVSCALLDLCVSSLRRAMTIFLVSLNLKSRRIATSSTRRPVSWCDHERYALHTSERWTRSCPAGCTW